MHFHCLQHVSSENLGRVADWIFENGHTLGYSRLFENDPLPDIQSFDALIILGGFMSVHDESVFPWLRAEKSFIGKALEQNKKILGICLGAQLIAVQLGAKVRRNPDQEIGFFPVHFSQESTRGSVLEGMSLPTEANVFHWHGETFDLPSGARRLASSEGCRNQAFVAGSHVLALQFHLEVTPRIVQDMIRENIDDLRPGKYVQSAGDILRNIPKLDVTNSLLDQILTKFFGSQS